MKTVKSHGTYKAGTRGPRRFGEHKLHQYLRKLDDTDLQAGDILIAKEWSPHNRESFFIPMAQAVLSHHHGASAASEHILLVVEDGEAKTAQAVNQGVLISRGIHKRDHVVYGCRDNQLAWEAVFVAERLGGATPGGTNEAAHRAGKSPVDFRSIPGTPTVLFRRKKKGKGASRRLQQIYDYVYDDEPLGAVRMVCSEFVTTCYEVAAMRLSEASGTTVKAFNVDPRAISAKALESLLRNAGELFKLSGRYRGTVSYTKSQMAEEARIKQAEREEALRGITTYGADHVPEAVLRARQARAAREAASEAG